MSDKLTDRVDFDILRYANCWEDAQVLIKGLDPKPGSVILSIGSAGDNSFSMLVRDPGLVVAIDVNSIQLNLIELKKIAIECLSYDELLEFLGFRESEDRLRYFNTFKKELNSNALKYWEDNTGQISKGIVNHGKFEHYFQIFSSKILPLIHSQKRVEELLREKGVEEQIMFYNKTWNNLRWRWLFKIFFSRYVMGKYGRDPEFLKEVKGKVSAFIFSKAEAHLKSTHAQSNPMLRYNLTGSFGNMLPHYLQPENYSLIKPRLNRIKIKQGFAEDAIKEYGKFSHMNLSNIFEYMNPDLFRKTAEPLIHALETDGRLAYWNLMVPRQISRYFPQKLQPLQELSETLSSVDQGFFYSRFIIEQKLD